MAIIINDFEIVIEQKSEPAQTQNFDEPADQQSGRSEPVPPVPPLRPEDIASILQFYQERTARLQAD